MEEEVNIHFPEWKLVDEFWDPVDSNTLLVKFTVVLPEVSRLLNYHK